MKKVRLANGNSRVLVFDDTGLLARLTIEQAEQALERGEVEPHPFPGRLRLIPQPIRVSENDKRKYRQQQERLRK